MRVVWIDCGHWRNQVPSAKHTYRHKRRNASRVLHDWDIANLKHSPSTARHSE